MMEETLTQALIGAQTDAAARVAWSLRPQTTPLPALVLHLVSRPRGYHTAGSDELSPGRVQVDCLAESYGAAKALARQAIAALDARRDLTGIQGVFIDHELDDVEHKAEAVTYRTAVDFIVWAEGV